jgi:hypothetical protein
MIDMIDMIFLEWVLRVGGSRFLLVCKNCFDVIVLGDGRFLFGVVLEQAKVRIR